MLPPRQALVVPHHLQKQQEWALHHMWVHSQPVVEELEHPLPLDTTLAVATAVRKMTVAEGFRSGGGEGKEGKEGKGGKEGKEGKEGREGREHWGMMLGNHLIESEVLQCTSD